GGGTPSYASCSAGAGDITDVGNCATGACFTSATANTVLAGPTSGAAAAATMRALVLADLPDNATSGLCLLSGGSGGDPNYASCPGGGSPAFSSITTGANTTASMTVGTGGLLDDVAASTGAILGFTLNGSSTILSNTRNLSLQ